MHRFGVMSGFSKCLSFTVLNITSFVLKRERGSQYLQRPKYDYDYLLRSLLVGRGPTLLLCGL